MGSFKRVSKRVLSGLICLMICLTFVSSLPTMVAHADSNARMQVNIQWAQNKGFEDMTEENLGEYTSDDLRMIGVFLSNFYSPFSTCLGKAADDSAEETKENMKDALVDQCNFDEDVAEYFVELVWNMSLETAQPLKIGKIDDDVHDTTYSKSKGYINEAENLTKGLEVYTTKEDSYGNEVSRTYLVSKNSDGETDASMYNFLLFNAGCMGDYEKLAWFSADKTDDAQTVEHQHYGFKTFVMYWTDSSDKDHIVWSNTVGQKDWDCGNLFTASTISYGILNDELSYDYGLGGASLLATDLDEFNQLSGRDQERAWLTSSQLYVDCFGNIILDNGILQTVILPACQNPYAWYNYDEGVNSAGKYVNLCNLYMMGEASVGNISFSDDADGEYSADNPVGNILPDRYIDYAFYRGSNSLFNQDLFRLYYGKADYIVDPDFGPFNSDVGKQQKKLFSDNAHFAKSDNKGDEKLQFLSWHCFADGDWSGSGYKVPTDFKHGEFTYYWYDPWFFKGTFNDICMIDNINAFSKDSDSITTVTLFGADGSFLGGKTLPNTNFRNIKERNKFITLSGASSKVYLTSIFLSYVYAYYDDSTGEDRKVSWAYNKDAFPTIENNIDWSSIEITSTALYDETLSLVNLFLHPTKGIKVVTTWFKNKISGILLGWHEDMVGKAGAASTTGSTKYVGFSGYVTIPNLDDLEWTAFIMDTYDQMVVYFIIVILIILLGYKMIGTMSWQKVILSGLLFAVCAYLPPRLINATVDASNQICNSFYGDKFTYWALVQHEQYASAINTAIAEDNEWNYLSTVFEQQAANTSDSYAQVTVKWQCPKKENYWADVKEEVTSVSNSPISKYLMQNIRDTISGESYTKAADNQYLYRSYTDLGTYANSLYENGKMESLHNTGDNPLQYNSTEATVSVAYKSLIENNITKGYKTAGGETDNTKAKEVWLEAYRNPYLCKGSISANSEKSEYGTRTATTALQAIRLGFNFDTARSSQYMLIADTSSLTGGSTLYERNRRLTDFSYCGSVNFAWSRGLIDRYASRTDPKTHPNIYCNLVYGVPLNTYNTTLADVNDRDNRFSTSTPTYVNDTSIASLVFANYTESPFMYFSYNLNDQLNSAKRLNLASSYKDLFLLKDGSYFYNMLTVGDTASTSNSVVEGGVPASEGYGEMRDYMDMRSLFYVVIPYLKSVNDVVVDYDNTYGLFMYDDVSLEYDSDNNIVLPEELQNLTETNKTEGASDLSALGGEDYYKYVHNWEVAQLLNMYTPWVDVMYDCSYAKGENIYVLGEKFYVKDPLDPLSYYKQDSKGNIIAGREMVFSRSEMAYYGLSMEDLTEVEQKIITISDNCYEDLLQILDYYNFQPEVLNTAIAMLETFEFNRQFSDTSLLGEDYVLYPQNYELKNFSYDAYLRLILAGTTGEDLNDLEEADIYTTVVKNSSILTALLFIILDLFTVYAIPALKLFFILGIFFMSILMILVATIRLDVKLSKALGDSLVFPLLKFFGVTVGMAWIVSLFMYDGNTAVTGRTSRIISLGDPTMAILVMLILNIAVLVLYWKICKGVLKDCKKYAQAVGTSVGGMFGGAVAMLGTGIGVGALMSKRGGSSKGERAPKKSDGSGGGSGNGNGSGSGITAGASGGNGSGGSGNSGGGVPQRNEDGTYNRVDKHGNFIKPKKTETAEHNKYDEKIDKAKEKAKNKTDKGMNKLAAREDVNTKRSNLEGSLRYHAENDQYMSDRQKRRNIKKADKLKAQREKSESKINRDFDRLANKDAKRRDNLDSKVSKLQGKSDKREAKIMRTSVEKSYKASLKTAKKQSRTAGKLAKPKK